MTRRITCYVVFVTLIWGVRTHNEEKNRDNMFKSNMTRNDFSNLLSSLIKLNEQRVSVLQRLYKLEDYGVLSEVLRAGDRKPENKNGNPNNLFLIVMSKNKTDPSRRNIDFEIVDTVTSLDVGSKKIQPKLNYFLDPADYISQNTHKENSIETIFGDIPKVQRPKKTLLIDYGSRKNITTKKPLKQHKSAQRSEVRDASNIVKAKKKVLKANEKKRNRNQNSKFKIVSNERNNNPSQELSRDFDEYIKRDSPIGYHEPPHYSETFVTKNVAIEGVISNNNHKYKNREDEHDYSSPFSKEYVDNTAHRQDTKTDAIKKSKGNRIKYILNNQSNKYTVTMTAIEPTANQNILRMISTVKSDKTDTLSNNNRNNKNPENEEDENDTGSPFSKEYVEDSLNRKYTKIDSDIAIKKVHGNNSLKPKKNTHRPKIRTEKVQDDQHSKLNRNLSILNNPDNKYTLIIAEINTTTAYSANRQDPKSDSDISTTKSKFYRIKPILNNHGNKYTTLKTVIKATTVKNELRIINSVNTDNTDTLSNINKNDKLPLEKKDLEDENYYGSPFSKEYDENSPIHQNTKINDYNPKINVQDKLTPNLNRSKSIMEQETTYSTTKTDLTTTTAKNDIKIVSTVNIDKANKNNQSINNPNLKIDLKDSKINHEHSSKETVLSNKHPSLSNQNAAGSKITETTNDIPFKNYNDYNYSKDVGNYTNKDNPGIARDLADEAENNTYSENPSPPVTVSENGAVKTTPPVKSDSPSHHKDRIENSNDDKPKAAKDLRIGNYSYIKPKKHKNHHGKEKSSNRGDFTIDKKKGDEFSIIITHLGKDKPEEIKQLDNLRVNPKEFDQPEGKPIERKAFQKCLNKKAKKLCSKSCISAYKNVCTRLKCTSKAKKALKKECKKSCEKTFKSSSSKYSDNDSDDSDSDHSDSDSS